MTATAYAAEVHTLTLAQALDLARKQSPDVLLARLDEQRAQAAVRIAHDPFAPKVYAGTGAAWTLGYPSSINGQPPSIFQTQANMSLFNRPQSWELARTKENARGSSIDTQSKIDDVLYRVASLWVDAAQAGRTAGFAAQETETMKTASQAVQARIGEGYELPIEGKRAELDVARATERATDAAADQDYAESSLAMVLGFPDSDRVRAVQQDDIGPNVKQGLPESEGAAVEQALHNSRELRLLESQLQAANFAVKEQKTQRLPQVDLVAQYALFARYNYKDFFPASSFRRNNAELGIAVRLPLLIGSAVSGAMSQAEVDMAKARIQTNSARSRIAVETRRSYGDLKRADDARSVARLDLDVARDQLSVLLAELDEGRASERQVSEARFTEQEKWIAFYQASYAVERARLNLLKRTGTLSAALSQ